MMHPVRGAASAARLSAAHVAFASAAPSRSANEPAGIAGAARQGSLPKRSAIDAIRAWRFAHHRTGAGCVARICPRPPFVISAEVPTPPRRRRNLGPQKRRKSLACPPIRSPFLPSRGWVPSSARQQYIRSAGRLADKTPPSTVPAQPSGRTANQQRRNPSLAGDPISSVSIAIEDCEQQGWSGLRKDLAEARKIVGIPSWQNRRRPGRPRLNGAIDQLGKLAMAGCFWKEEK